MAILELSVFPQASYVEGQGLVGIRRWSLDAQDDPDTFCQYVCDSFWPTNRDCIPVSVSYGAFPIGAEYSAIIRQNGVRHEYDLGNLPTYGKYLVEAQYLLHRMTNCWPYRIPKPWHAPGTVLSLQIKAAAQALIVTPAGTRGVKTPSDLCATDYKVEGLPPSITSRLIIPVTEFHISCDRMTLDQVNIALARGDDLSPDMWDLYQGCVNKVSFLGAAPYTLLFDGYEITETFACDLIEPCRYRMTAVLKQRTITDNDGIPIIDRAGNNIGWNHDWVPIAATGDASQNSKLWDWRVIKLGGGGAESCYYRYSPANLHMLFGYPNSGDYEQCCGCDTSVGPELTDSAVCQPFDFVYPEDTSASNQGGLPTSNNGPL